MILWNLYKTTVFQSRGQVFLLYLFLFWPVLRLEIWWILDESTSKQSFAQSVLFCEFRMACISVKHSYILYFALAQLVRTSLVLRFTARIRLLNTWNHGALQLSGRLAWLAQSLSMDRALRPVMAKVCRVRFPVKPKFFQGLLSTASVVYSTATIMLTFISLLLTHN